MPRKKKTEIEAIEAAPVTKTAPAAKRTVRKSEPKVAMKVQIGEREYDIDAIRATVLKACKGKVKSVKTVEVYVKPEDNAAYYVVNSEVEDKIDL